MKRIIAKGILLALTTFISTFAISLQNAATINKESVVIAALAALTATFSGISQFLDKGVANANMDKNYK